MCNHHVQECSNMENQQVAIAVFKCRPNSHPFGERVIMVNEPVKIGRSVARTKPADNNAIFDCKVLSRNHALLWFDSGKFYLQDTKSSNGTFVNNQRLSRNSEESVAREISSGDIIQFGVDVVENQRKVTHSCIVATVTLYLPDGKEAKQSSYTAETNGLSPSIQCQELYSLQIVIQEALHREQMLEQKLATLGRLVATSQEASESGWQALIDEDRLLAKLELLEKQLSVYTGKGDVGDTIRQEMEALQADKLQYESKAKESLKRALEEKVEAVKKLKDIEHTYSSTEDECSHLKEVCEKSEKELQDLAGKYEEEQKRIRELTENLQKVEQTSAETLEKTEREKAELEKEVEEMKRQEDGLKAKIESLQEEADFTRQQVAKMKEYVDETQQTIKDKELGHITNITDVNRPSINGQDNHTSLTEQLKATQEQIQCYKIKLNEKDEILEENKRKVDELRSHLERAKVESSKNRNSMMLFQDKLKNSDLQVHQVVENVVNSIKVQLKESHSQRNESEVLVRTLRGCIEELESEVKSQEAGDAPLQPPSENGEEGDGPDAGSQSEEISVNTLKEKLDDLENIKKKLENEVFTYKGELESAHMSTHKQKEEMSNLESNINRLTSQLQSKTDEISRLKGEQENRVGIISPSSSHHECTSHPPEELSTKGELESLKNDCANLRLRITTVESELDRSRKENHQLSCEYKRLEESSKHLQSSSGGTGTTHPEKQWKLELNKARQEAEDAKRQLEEVQSEAVGMREYKERCEHQQTELEELRGRVDNLAADYQMLAYQSKTLSVFSVAPLILLLLAIFLAFSPFLSSITATSP